MDGWMDGRTDGGMEGEKLGREGGEGEKGRVAIRSIINTISPVIHLESMTQALPLLLYKLHY